VVIFRQEECESKTILGNDALKCLFVRKYSKYFYKLKQIYKLKKSVYFRVVLMYSTLYIKLNSMR